MLYLFRCYCMFMTLTCCIPLTQAHVNGCDCLEGEVCVPEENETNVFRCEIGECPVPHNPSYGEIFGNVVRTGSRIRYRCHHGYIANGELVRKCQLNGEWSGTQQPCIPEQVCPVGSTQWGNSCYLVVTSSSLRKTFAGAESYCSEGGGYLATVTSEEEHVYVKSKLKTGLNIDVSKYWIGIKLSATKEWVYSVNMSTIGYSSWAKAPGNKECVAYVVDPALNAWKWGTHTCTEIEFLICEYDIQI